MGGSVFDANPGKLKQKIFRAAALALALGVASFGPPAHSQSAPVRANSARPCDGQSDCPAARKALADALARQSQHVAQQPAPAPAPAAPAPAPGYGGLAAAAAAKAEENSIRLGLIAPFTGANKDFAGELKLGAETAFAVANEAGGVNGKFLKLVAADDGYDPARTPAIARNMVEKEHVFGFLSNFGSPTAAAILPYVMEHKLCFFGAFSGAGVLRQQPPDRYVFNYRPSYAEETGQAVHYLVKVRHIRPSEIAVFAQDDAFGEAGFIGAEKELRGLDEKASANLLHAKYARNTIDVAQAIEEIQKRRDRTKKLPGVKAVVMVATYRAAAKFIEKARELWPDMLFTNVSAVGSNNFADELKLLGPRYVDGVVVTQVTPDPAGYSSIALEFKAALAKYFPTERADYVSFESYINARILMEGLKRAGPQPDSEKLVAALETVHGLDFGLGAPINYSASEHQAIHKVWGSQLDDQGRYHFIDME